MIAFRTQKDIAFQAGSLFRVALSLPTYIAVRILLLKIYST